MNKLSGIGHALRSASITTATGLAMVLAMVLGILLSAGVTANAQTPASIKEKGTLVVGVQADQIPWGFIDEKGENAGYDVEIAKMVADQMGVKIEYVRVTVANRIAALLTGKVDVLAAVMGMYPERAKVVQFTKPYSKHDIIVIGKKTDPIKEMADLGNHRVGVTRAAMQDIAITKSAPPSTSIQRFDDDSTAIQALVSGQADAIGGTSTNLININRIAPDKYEEKIRINRQYNGFAVRPGQKELVAWLNDFLTRNTANGSLNALNKKWLGEDLPEFPKEMPGIPYEVM